MNDKYNGSQYDVILLTVVAGLSGMSTSAQRKRESGKSSDLVRGHGVEGKGTIWRWAKWCVWMCASELREWELVRD